MLHRDVALIYTIEMLHLYMYHTEDVTSRCCTYIRTCPTHTCQHTHRAVLEMYLFKCSMLYVSLCVSLYVSLHVSLHVSLYVTLYVRLYISLNMFTLYSNCRT